MSLSVASKEPDEAKIIQVAELATKEHKNLIGPFEQSQPQR